MPGRPQWMSMADPIHGMIRLKRHHENHQLLLEVMNSRAFQRLRRIRQMGMAEFVFPGATHSRFVHSIGATWLMIKAIDVLQEMEETRHLLRSPFLDTGIPLDRLLLLCILVHDIGHTPLSHTLEDILNLKESGMLHDTYWNKLILENDEELAKIWARFGAQLPVAASRFMGLGEDPSERHFLADLVSSQMDMDRLDYLQRDAHYLGVQYGRVETERIITNLAVGKMPNGQEAVAIREESIPAIEHYLFGRYQAYKMALHSLDKASETLLKLTLNRFAHVRDQDINTGAKASLLYRFIRDGRSLTADEYLMLDDCYLWDKINVWARKGDDDLLKQLANRLLGHDLLKYVEVIPDKPAPIAPDTLTEIAGEMRAHYESRGLSFEFGYDEMFLIPKALYQPMPHKPPIWVKRKAGSLVDFANVSALPLHGGTQQGSKHLFFVWDTEAKTHLKKILLRLLPDTPINV